MPFKEGREYRSFDAVEALEAGYIVEGYATTYDQPYQLGYGGMNEVIRHDALIGADMSDVIFQLNHEGQVLARLRNGSLSIDNDPHGMHIRADLGGSEAGRNLYEAIKNGLIDRMSWGFIVDDDGWEYDPKTRTSTITKVSKVFDVSAVSLPANDGTEIQARSYLDGVIEEQALWESERRFQDELCRARALIALSYTESRR